jgi:hypothetical protein
MIGAFLRQRPAHPLAGELAAFATHLEYLIAEDRRAA